MLTSATLRHRSTTLRATLARRPRAAAIALALGAAAPQHLGAQSAQRYSVQLNASVSTIQPDARAISGAGLESQFRFNRIYTTEDFGAISLGIGAQGMIHSAGRERYQIIGVFLEPRWALPLAAGCAHPYLSSRVGAERVAADFGSLANESSNGVSFGAGAGIAFRVTRTTNLDVGAQLVRRQIGSISGVSFSPGLTYAARVGITLGVPH